MSDILMWTILTVVILTLTYTVVEEITEEEFIFEDNCIDKDGGIFNDEICTYTRSCGFLDQRIYKEYCFGSSNTKETKE